MNKTFFFLICIFAFSFFSCEPKQEEELLDKASQIKVLNGCGVSKAAQKMTDYLMSKGFDVVEKGNAEHWHYKKTMIVSAVRNTEVAKRLSKNLGDASWVQIIDSSQLVTAVVIVGHDFYKFVSNSK